MVEVEMGEDGRGLGARMWVQELMFRRWNLEE